MVLRRWLSAPGSKWESTLRPRYFMFYRNSQPVCSGHTHTHTSLLALVRCHCSSVVEKWKLLMLAYASGAGLAFR